MKATTDFRFFKREFLGNPISVAIVAVFFLSLTFTTAQASDIIYSPTGIVDYSGTQNDNFPATNLIDSAGVNTFGVIFDDTDGDAPDLVTGHVLFDLGQNLEITKAILTARDELSKPYGPSSVEFYYFGDNNPYDNTGVLDDIEGDSDIISLGTYSVPDIGTGASCEIALTTNVTTQYLGMRVLDSYETGLNFQLSDVSFAGPAANVPEPSTLVLLFGMTSSLLLFRRK